jgi:Zn finger protein HypA/HybF involved in hydrogenase expression
MEARRMCGPNYLEICADALQARIVAVISGMSQTNRSEFHRSSNVRIDRHTCVNIHQDIQSTQQLHQSGTVRHDRLDVVERCTDQCWCQCCGQERKMEIGLSENQNAVINASTILLHNVRN